jgi:hypothetical protein
VLLGEHHGRVEADDRRAPGDVDDRADDLLAHLGLEEVELGGVVPRKRRAIVAVVDVARVAGPAVEALEDDRGVAVVPVVVLEEDPDALIGREVRAVERVARVRCLGQRQEPVRMVDHPARVDAHVVRDHVAGHPDATLPGPGLERLVGTLPAEVVGDPVVVERVGAGDGVRVAAQALDPLRRGGALPQADQPQPGDAPRCEAVELLVGDRVEGPDVATEAARQLVEPDVGALGDEDDPRHPLAVRAEALRLVVAAPQRGRLCDAAEPAAGGAAAEAEVERPLLLGDHVERHEQSVEQAAQQRRPAVADVAELAGEGRGRGRGGGAQQLDQRLAIGSESGLGGEELLERGERRAVVRLALQRAVVEQLAERLGGRVRVRQPGQEELLEGEVARFGRTRELALEGPQQALRLAVAAFPGDGRQRVAEGGRTDLGLVALDEVMEDLVQQPQRVELPGLDHRGARRGAGQARAVHRGCEAPRDGWPGERHGPVRGAVDRCPRVAAHGRALERHARAAGHASSSSRIPRSGIDTQSGRLLSS